MSHDLHDHHDSVGLLLARRIAEGLPSHPEWLALARRNLDRWSALNADAPGLLRSYAQWREVLERPASDVCAAMLAETSEGQRLRQNSPFAGALAPDEVRDIKRRARHEAKAA